MPPAGFEPTILIGERPQTHASDRATAATGFRKTILTYLLTYLLTYSMEQGPS